MNHLEIRREAEGLAALLIGRRLQHVWIGQGRDLILDFSRHLLLISCHPAYPRIHLIGEREATGHAPPAFVMLLRKHLIGERLEKIEAMNGERIVRLHFEPSRFILTAEIFGSKSNIIFLDEQSKILGALYKRGSRISAGENYQPPAFRSAPIVNLRDFGPDVFAAQRFFDPLIAIYDREQTRQAYLKAAVKEMNRINKYLIKLKSESEKLPNPAAQRKQAEALLIHRNIVAKGSKEINLPDPYDPTVSVSIVLDPAKGIQQNIDHLFAGARRSQRKAEALSKRISEMGARVEKLSELVLALDAEDGQEKVFEKLKFLGIVIQSKTELSATKPKMSGQRISAKGPYLLEDGAKIYVGVDADDNERITFGLGRADDFWLHVSGAPGSHVLVKLPAGAELSQQRLIDAAMLAVHHSRFARQGRGEVIYTRRRFVTKIKGAPKGEVRVAKMKTIFVKVDSSRIERLKQLRQAE